MRKPLDPDFMTTRRAGHRALAGLLGATTLALAVAGAARASTAPASGFGVPVAQARETLRGYPLRTLSGEAVPLSALQGEVVVVHFWASWCGPCRRELPKLDLLNAEISKKGGRVLAISIDEQRENVNRFARAHGLRLAIVHDGPAGLAHALDIRQLPFTVIVDRNGDLAYTTGRSDEAGLNALAAATRQLVAVRAIASSLHEGDQP